MAIYRNVNITFWTDSKVVDDFTPEDRYFYLYLFTNPHTNLAGCYEVSMKQIANETGYSTETVERLIGRFQSVHRVIAYDRKTKELLLLNWSRYNWTKSDKLRTALSKEIESVKTDGFREYLSKIFGGADTVSIPYPYGMDTTDTDTDTNTDTNTVSNTDKSNNSIKSIKKAKPEKHRFGEYQNVLLTDRELELLMNDYPDYKDRIEELSVYMASKGDKYKSHYATIKNWARRGGSQRTATVNPVAEKLNDFYGMAASWGDK